MLQRMLTERFHLKLHREMRPIPVYALVVANPAKIKEITKEPLMTRMVDFAGSLQRRVDGPVLDETKLTGYYEIATPEWMQPGQERTADSVGKQAEMFSELESNDGLKLDARKDPFAVLVIDQVERPTSN